MRSIYFLLLAACGGGSDLDPGAGDSPGDGTNTLFVHGEVRARPRLTNARSEADFETEVSVRVMLNQQAVTGGTVVVTSGSGEFPLAYRASENRWEGTIAGYDEVYILDVESDADKVTGVRVDGPDLHFFKAPTAGATVDARIPLDIAWESDQRADSASLDAEEIDSIAIPDTGTYVLAAGALKADRDQARTNQLRLTRANRVTPKGAVGGSELSVEVENAIEVVAMPAP